MAENSWFLFAEPRIELQGHLASMLRLAGAFGSENAKSPPGAPDGLGVLFSSVKVDAGTRKRLDLLLTG
jgi:hypothetical protein